MRIKARIAAVLIAGLMMLGLGVGPAAAQPVVTGGVVNVTVTNVLNDVTVDIEVEDIHVAVQLCANLNALAEQGDVTIECRVNN